ILISSLFPDTSTILIYTLSYTTLFRSTYYKGGEIFHLESFPRIHAVDENNKLTLYSETEPDDDFIIGDDAPTFEIDVTDEEVERSEEHTSELQSRFDLVCRLLLEQKN